jgi:acetyl-CoA C-acetyltransferase
MRRMARARDLSSRLALLQTLRPADIRLYVPRVQNRVTGKSMGEHCEDMAKTWNITRQEQDELALASHRAAVAAQDRGFFDDLIVPVDNHARDDFPRRDTSLERLARLHPAFDTTSGRGTLTAGNSSPLTDGAAAVWVATERDLADCPAPRRACAWSISRRQPIFFTKAC